jgi:hypothetical protein
MEVKDEYVFEDEDFRIGEASDIGIEGSGDQ